MLVQVRADLDSFEEADRPPSVLCAFFLLEGQSKFILIVVRPRYNSVSLAAKLM